MPRRIRPVHQRPLILFDNDEMWCYSAEMAAMELWAHPLIECKMRPFEAGIIRVRNSPT
ncbi:hypothetical protein EG327_007979, partial [Venturia inaequalis]